MERISCTPRENYREIVEKQGFGFHESYWMEDACYCFTSAEIEALEKATAECYEMYCKAVEACLYDNRRLDALCIPAAVREAIVRSWEEDDYSLYGRFDFAFVSGVPKLLEFNADTPTSLVEAAVIQWLWKEDVFPSHDQFNSIHEKMVESWKYIHERYQCGRYYFASISDCLEDNATLGYIISTAFEAGLVPYELDIRSIRHENGSLFAPDGMPIDCMFKLYPWEFMFAEDLTGCMTEMCWIEPLWKALMSDKAMLPVLYEMFPRSPYILPAYAEPGKLGAYCKKPVFSREGANVELVKNGTILESSSGGYGKEGYIYQQLVDIPCFDGRYPVLGSWVIGGEAAGMGIRENTSRITDDMSHFVPHIIV